MTDIRKNTAAAPLSEQSLPAVPAELLELTAADAGAGVSSDPANLILPLITVLQTNSPQVEKRGPAYIDGAEPGGFRFRGDLVEKRDGVTGFICIPCGMQTVFNEWGPTRGSGLLGRHLAQPDDAESRISDEGGAKRPLLVRRGSGNVIQQSREFYLLVDGNPYVLAFHGTGHTTARKWQSHFHLFTHPTTGKLLPSYARKYLLTTVPQTNALGRWFGIKFEDRGFVSKAEYSAARKLHEIIERGAYRVEMSGSDAAQAAA